MATGSDSGSRGGGLSGALKDSPATQESFGQARKPAQAQGSKLSEGLGSKLTSTTGKLGEVGENGSLSPLTEGVKRLAQGDSPVKAAASCTYPR
ncbi:MAG: hypothetical protein JO147_05905, partial [Actinobacteria bacterium]|nr:hypothetical protein [Actinomycetota bacterium]